VASQPICIDWASKMHHACRAVIFLKPTWCHVQLTFAKGRDDIVTVRLPGSPVQRHYCRICHVRVYRERFDGEHIDRQVGRNLFRNVL